MRVFIATLCLLAAGLAGAITPPVITQPTPGVLHFTCTAPTTRANGSALALAEIGGYKLYLTNETAAILIPGSTCAYDYPKVVDLCPEQSEGAVKPDVHSKEWNDYTRRQIECRRKLIRSRH